MVTIETIQYTKMRVQRLLHENLFYQEHHRKELADYVAQKRWSQVAGTDGIIIGLLRGEAALRQELKDLDKIAEAVVAAKS